MDNKLRRPITGSFLLKFALPTIISTVLMGLFGLVDGIFVSRIIDPLALSGVGIVWPFMSFVMAIGYMLGTGGNALIAKKIGEGKEVEGRQNFTMITIIIFLVSTILSLLGLLAPDLLLNILGADDIIWPMAMDYLIPMLYFLPAVMLGGAFQQFFITEGKAHILTFTTVAGGVLNIGLNFLLIYHLGWGLSGAAIATSAGYALPALVGLYYFTFKRNGLLHFVKPTWDWKVIVQSSTNGVSEMITLLAGSITATLMNNILIRLYGPEAVAANGIIQAGMWIIAGIFFGYSWGIMPVISYNYGEKNPNNLKKLVNLSMKILGLMGVASILVGWLMIDPFIAIYEVPASSSIHAMAVTGFRIFTVGYIFMAYNAFIVALFTSLNNGKMSGFLSFFRTLVFVVISLLVLPELFGMNGAWAAMPFAEFLSIILCVYWLKKKAPEYGYGGGDFSGQ